ncbi:MAG: hypothetical protein M1829_006070 [Trizodia sp. TS-e1964]|nr:MAG: hypothetical protein M1829_006070 [Trizodia sp. TS-e1964]
MVRKGQPSRGSSNSNKKPSASLLNPDESYIVFTNSKEKEKEPNQPETKALPSRGAQKLSVQELLNVAPASILPVVPKLDTKTLIGGASWTGKLPVNLLSEHCQKQRWEKPQYIMSKSPDGFSSMVILKVMNPKTKLIEDLPPFKLPSTHKHLAVQPTSVEARHFAATYALFRVCSMRNIHMMLPPHYRDLWKNQFQELKKDDVVGGRSWMYEADPFVVVREREESKRIMAKKGLGKDDHKTNVPNEPGRATQVSKSDVGNKNLRGWIKIPRIEMGKRMRVQIESLIRKGTIWNPHSIKIPPQNQKTIVEQLSELGFRRSHAEEAVSQCKDNQEAIDWLLIHVPEDDLPSWCLPEGYAAGISMASGNLKREAIIKRLATGGYSTEICEETLDSYNGEESAAAEHLQRILLGDKVNNLTLDEAQSQAESAGVIIDTGSSIWNEELTTLEAIFGNRFHSVSPDVIQIDLRPGIIPQDATLQVRKPLIHPYPSICPILTLIAMPILPAHIRLSLIKRMVNHASSNLLGEPMVFSIVDWLEAEIANVVARPGKLRDVASLVSTKTPQIRYNGPQKLQTSKKLKRHIDERTNIKASLEILADWEQGQRSEAQQKMMSARRSLPAWNLKDEIVDTVCSHQVTIISGETGSGKSTQSVQYILDDMIQRKLGSATNIICTQPRRISALGLADRVSEERCSVVGREVGYAIRGESRQTPGRTRITFVTTGVLLRRLQTSGGSSDDVVTALADVSHVFVDEVHERSLDTDFLLALLKEVLKRRKDLKVILMSATLDAAIFEDYFAEIDGKVGKVEIEGRTHPVEDIYLDAIIRQSGFNPLNSSGDIEAFKADEIETSKAIQNIGARINYDLIASVVRMIDAELGIKEGGILIFLPGVLEINRTLASIRDMQNVYALPLHASLIPAEQRRVFPPAPKGKRKVIAATNVAETSITIEDIVAVIDTGRVKETSYNAQTNMVKLEEVWASRAACKQRRGRAGRVKAGHCYKLYTRNAETTKMRERPDPEIKRVPLEQLCLSVKAMGIVEVGAFLSTAITPPAHDAVQGAIDILRRMGAIDGKELTALGRHLAMIPADLRCGKLMVYGAAFGCLEACLVIASILTTKSPFVSPIDKREEAKSARMAFSNGHGDLIGDLRAYEEWNTKRHSTSPRDLRMWCEQNYLSSYTLNDILSNKSQYLVSLKEIGFLPLEYRSSEIYLQNSFNAHNSNNALVRALVAGAFNPQIARIQFPEKKYAASVSGAIELDPEARMIKYFNEDNGRIFIHPSSTLFTAQSFPGSASFISYFNKMATTNPVSKMDKISIRDVTPCNSYSLLLFSGPITLDTLGRGLFVDHWIRLRGWARIGVLISRLRMMLDDVLAQKIDNPGMDMGSNEVVGIVRRLVELDGMDQ